MECHTRWEEEQVGGLMYSILRFFIFILNLIINFINFFKNYIKLIKINIKIKYDKYLETEKIV
jgi:hypothetical protein